MNIKHLSLARAWTLGLFSIIESPNTPKKNNKQACKPGSVCQHKAGTLTIYLGL
jgi:hypothetical protein